MTVERLDVSASSGGEKSSTYTIGVTTIGNGDGLAPCVGAFSKESGCWPGSWALGLGTCGSYRLGGVIDVRHGCGSSSLRWGDGGSADIRQHCLHSEQILDT
ncbi:MAG: hypothetical protein EOO04_01125 [Chitinophagaceae bacterium]|nr:MAG: hypothetical protein EOO04_01125 [Chitinophagaceae bacterium]